MKLTDKKYEFTPLLEPIPITEQTWPAGTQPLVHTRTMTFMHENYIRRCIDGILMQKTTFPVQVLIHEDTSTDKTANIVREYEKKYPSLIKVYYQAENSYSKPNKHERREEFMSWCIGKYEAMCEGDDYWTDPYKLQKQVDFLEANPEYGMVHSELGHLYTSSGKFIERFWQTRGVTKQEGDIYKNMLLRKGSMIYLCTACFRTSLIKQNKEWDRVLQNIPTRDTAINLHLARHGKVGYLKEPTAVRRVLEKSATQGQSFKYYWKFITDGEKILTYFANISNLTEAEHYELQHKLLNKRLNVCYRYAPEGKEKFKEAYGLLPKSKRTRQLKIKKLGMSNTVCLLLSKILLRIVK